MTETTPTQERHETASRGVLTVCLLLFFALLITRFIRYARTSLLAMGPVEGRDQFAGAALDPSKLLAVAILGLLVAALFARPNRPLLRIDVPGKALIAFSLFCFMSVIWAYEPRHTFMWAVRMTQWVFLYIALISVTRSDSDLHRWGHVFLIASVLNMLAIIQERIAPATAFGGFAGQEVQATYLVLYPRWALVFLAFALHSTLQGKTRSEKIVGLLAVIANLVTIYLSQRRGAPPVVGVMLLTYLFATGWRDRRFIAVLGVLTAAFVAAIMLDPGYARRLSTIPFLGTTDLAYWQDNQRVINYLAGFELFAAHPILGAGLGATYPWSMDHLPVSLVQHSLILNLLSEVGVVGFSLYALFIYAAIRRMVRTIRRTRTQGNRLRESFTAATLTALIGILFWAQLQPSLSALEIYLCCGLGSVAAAEFSEEPARNDPADHESA